MVDLLNANEEVLHEFQKGSRYEYPDVRERLPPAVWSRLFFDLDFFLGSTTASGVSVLNFYHRQLAHVARSRYLEANSEKLHRTLVQYFEGLQVWYVDAERMPNRRRAYELPHQCRMLGTPAANAQLQDFLISEEFVEAKIAAGLGLDLLNDYFEIESLEGCELDRIVHFFETQYTREESPLSQRFRPEDLHSFFAYRGDAVFYRALLGSLTRLSPGVMTDRARRVRSRARIDLGGLLRRQRKFDEARALLEVVNDEWSGLTKENLGVGWYEIGYLSYVQDEYREAARAMHKSVELAEEGADPVGAAISRTVEMWASYFDQPSRTKLAEMIEEERRSLALFTERQHADPRAFRWVMNVLAHLVNASYLMGDAIRLVEYLRELRANPWIREFESPSWLLPYEARYAMTLGDYRKAVSDWEKFFQENRIKTTAEGGAWPVLDYGISLAKAGRLLRAAAVFRRGLKLERKGANNAHWQRQIGEELKRLPLGLRLLSSFSGWNWRFEG